MNAIDRFEVCPGASLHSWASCRGGCICRFHDRSTGQEAYSFHAGLPGDGDWLAANGDPIEGGYAGEIGQDVSRAEAMRLIEIE